MPCQRPLVSTHLLFRHRHIAPLPDEVYRRHPSLYPPSYLLTPAQWRRVVTSISETPGSHPRFSQHHGRCHSLRPFAMMNLVGHGIVGWNEGAVQSMRGASSLVSSSSRSGGLLLSCLCTRRAGWVVMLRKGQCCSMTLSSSLTRGHGVRAAELCLACRSSRTYPSSSS